MSRTTYVSNGNAGSSSNGRKIQTAQHSTTSKLKAAIVAVILLVVQWLVIEFIRATACSETMSEKSRTTSASYTPLITSFVHTDDESSKQVVLQGASIGTNYERYNGDAEVRHLLSNVLATVAVWHDDKHPYKDFAYLGHVLGTIADWRTVVGNLTIVIVTNDAIAMEEKLDIGLQEIIQVREIDMTNIHGYYLPFFHRNVIDEYIQKPNPPTAYSFFEEDTVLSAEGLKAWARDTIHLKKHQSNFTRHFFRWEYNKEKDCVAMNSQVRTISRTNSDTPKGHAGRKIQPSTDIHTIGGRPFVALYGKWAGMYVFTHEHMKAFHESGTFFTRPDNEKYAREYQLYAVMEKNANFTESTSFRVYTHSSGNMAVPLDEDGQLDMISGVHHQSDKYTRMKFAFGKLCVKDLFVDR